MAPALHEPRPVISEHVPAVQEARLRAYFRGRSPTPRRIARAKRLSIMLSNVPARPSQHFMWKYTQAFRDEKPEELASSARNFQKAMEQTYNVQLRAVPNYMNRFQLWGRRMRRRPITAEDMHHFHIELPEGNPVRQLSDVWFKHEEVRDASGRVHTVFTLQKPQLASQPISLTVDGTLQQIMDKHSR